MKKFLKLSANVVALILAVCLLLPVAVGCKEQKLNNTGDSSTVVSQEADTNGTSSTSSKTSNVNNKNDKDKNSSTNSTVSYDVNFWRPGSPNDDDDDYDYDSDYEYNDTFDEETSSSTQSESVKVSKDGVKIGMYHLSMRWCDSYGTSFEDREREFREVVEAGYFNTYFLHAQDFDKGYLLKEAEIIAKSGGTFWMTLWNYHSDNKLLNRSEKLEDHEAALKKIIDALTLAGYRDNLVGMIWDEPIWNGQENKDFLTQSELYYKKFGLRTFPVFATGEFSGIEGNLDTPAAKMGKIATDALKYVTDVGFDSYGVDVRLNKPYVNGKQSGQYSAWAKELGVSVQNGQDYYTGYKKLLKNRVNHDVNIWYFPTAFEWNTWNGGKANEEYCIAQLKFMAEDILKEKNQGGLALYTYYRHSSHKTVAFAQHCDIKDQNGNYARYPEFSKWTKYCNLLRSTRAKFDSIKAKTVDLGL